MNRIETHPSICCCMLMWSLEDVVSCAMNGRRQGRSGLYPQTPEMEADVEVGA